MRRGETSGSCINLIQSVRRAQGVWASLAVSEFRHKGFSLPLLAQTCILVGSRSGCCRIKRVPDLRRWELSGGFVDLLRFVGWITGLRRSGGNLISPVGLLLAQSCADAALSVSFRRRFSRAGRLRALRR